MCRVYLKAMGFTKIIAYVRQIEWRPNPSKVRGQELSQV